jgi:glycosyltransferase involved in cell wall biosynthesis
MLMLMDCRPLQYAGHDSGKRRLIFSLIAGLAEEQKMKWLFVVDQTYRPEFFPEVPAGLVIVRRAFPGRAGWALWYDWQIPRLARSERADLVMLTGGIAAALPAITQCIWMPEAADPAQTDVGPRRLSIYPGRLASSLRRAASVFCFSDRDRVWLAGRYPEAGEKIIVLRASAEKGIMPLDPAEKKEIKAAIVQGREYFLASLDGVGEEDMTNLLKAFSQFKKRQHSNMQLVLAGRIAGEPEKIKKRMKAYKYRSDVQWLEDVAAADVPRLTGAAYAAVFLADGFKLGVPMLDAWAAGVPVIVVNGGLLHEMAEEAALGAAAGDPAALAAQLMLIYKDEHFRQKLIAKAMDRLGTFSRQRSLDVLQAAMRRAIKE